MLEAPTDEIKAFASAGPTVEPMLPVSVEPLAKIRVRGAQTARSQPDPWQWLKTTLNYVLYVVRGDSSVIGRP